MNAQTAATRINKYLYGWKLMVNYGQGWEYEIFELTLREAQAQRACYRENCPQYAVKLVRGRELNPDYAITTEEAQS